MTTATAVIQTPTINYTKIDNNYLRACFTDEKLTAKDIFLYALSCIDTWIFTSEGIAGHFGLINKQSSKNEIRNALLHVNRLLNILIKKGLCTRKQSKDPKTGYFTRCRYTFHIQKKLHAVKSPQKPENQESVVKSPDTRKPVSVPINNNNRKDNNRAGSNEPADVVSFQTKKEAAQLHNEINPDKKGNASKQLIEKLIKGYGIDASRALIAQINENEDPTNAGAYLGRALSDFKQGRPWEIVDKEKEQNESYQSDIERLEHFKQLESQARHRGEKQREKQFILFKGQQYEIGEAGEVELNGAVYNPGQVIDFINRGIFEKCQ